MSLEKRITDAGYEDVVIFSDYGYEDAFIGISEDNRAIYDYDLMVQSLIVHEHMSEEEAVEWIDFNTIRALPYAGEKGPIVMYRLEEN